MAFKAKVVAFVGTLCLIGVAITFLPRVNQQHRYGAVDVRTTNRQKAELADVQGIEELAANVYNHSNSMRWGIFGFNAARTTVQPLAYGSKTWDWLGDFKTFMDSFPEDDVAYGIYDFEYWMNKAQCRKETGTNAPCFASRSIMFTWSPEDVEPRRLALGGYFLSSVLVAAEGFGQVAGLTDADHGIGYMGVCDKLLLEGSSCHMADAFANGNCPFDDASSQNPCSQETCRGAQLLSGGIPEPCCNYIKDYCGAMDDEDAVQGCHIASLHLLEQSCATPLHPEAPHLSHDVHFALCSPRCYERECIFFKDLESYKYCNSCTEEEGAKCYPGAVDFVGMECCPTTQEAADDGICGIEEYQNQVGCGMIKERGCDFMKNTDCPEFVVTVAEEDEVELAEEAEVE